MRNRNQELDDLYRLNRSRCRALLLRRLWAAGGSVAVAARAEGLERGLFVEWLRLVDLIDAPARIKRELRQPAPPSEALERWMAAAG